MSTGRQPQHNALSGCTWLIACSGIGLGLWFAPGWANGWPLGLHRNLVWPLGLSVLAFFAVIGAIVGVGPVRVEEAEANTSVSRVTRIAGVIGAGIVAGLVFLVFRSQAIAIWP